MAAHRQTTRPSLPERLRQSLTEAVEWSRGERELPATRIEVTEPRPIQAETDLAAQAHDSPDANGHAPVAAQETPARRRRARVQPPPAGRPPRD